MKTQNEGTEIKMMWITKKIMQIKRHFKKDDKVLFLDGNCHNVYSGELIYYIVLSAGGTYKVGWDFSDEIYKRMEVWHTLISLSVVKGLYKSKTKAEEYCNNANAGSAKEISKQFFTQV